jgi:Fe-S cluster assembly protein SufD
MNVEARPTRTAADEGFVKAFAEASAGLPGGSSVSAQRTAAFGRFEACGLPTRRIEQWKYTDLRNFLREARPLAGVPGAEERERAKLAGAAFTGVKPRRLVFVDGSFIAELSDLAVIEEGLTITSLADALSAGTPEVVKRLGESNVSQADIAYALNTAFMADGVVINVAAGKHALRPIHLVFAYSSDKPASVFVRSLVTLGEGARLTLIESHEAFGAQDYHVNSAINFELGDGAELDHVKLGADGAQAVHVATTGAVLGANARLRDFALTLGGAMVRNQVFLTCMGTGAVADLRGASLIKGRQHVDTTLVLDHAAPGCQSRELFKAVLDDESRSVFQGKIIVRPKAQQTDARMMTRSLLLSETAETNNKPELEIFADDVQCGHGATSGALDDQLKFYLMARGIPADEAEALLIKAFLGEVIDGITQEGIRVALTGIVNASLDARG